MTTDDILSGLRNRIIGQQIQIYDRVSSTNDLALQCGVDGAQEGTLILAESQTQGRGRHGRRWHAPPGSSILASAILRHRLRANQVGLPNLIGAVAIATAINELTDLSTQIKWPNDVLIQGKKVSGVLTELEYDRHRQPFFVMGFGVNANTTSADLPEKLHGSATSLRMESNRKISRVALLQAILHRLEENYLCLKHGETDPIIATANGLLHLSGDWIEIKMTDGVFRGHAESIDQDGGLLLRDMNGKRQKFFVGEVLQTGRGNVEKLVDEGKSFIMAIGTKNRVIKGCGAHHIAVHTRDWEDSLRLYRDVLGMEIIAEFGPPDRKILLLDMGDGSHMELFQPTLDGPKPGDPAPNNPVHHFALTTTDIHGAVEHVREAGYEITVEPRDVDLGGLHVAIAFFRGPNGESVEFFQTN